MAAIVDGAGDTPIPVPAGAPAVTVAVAVAAQNDSDSSNSREEGELSHSDSRESGSASEHDCADSAQIGSVRPSPRTRTGQEAKEVKYSTGLSSSKVGVSSRASPHGENVKGSDKNRGFVPFLIGFSDDDSGSDSEDSRSTSHSAEVSKPEGVGRPGPSSHQSANRGSRQPMPSRIGSKKVQPELTKKPIYNEVSQNRPIVARTNGPTPRSAGQKSGSRNINSLQGRAVQNQIPEQVHDSNNTLDYNMQQVHDLRELIAIRESEVIKGAQQVKSSVGDLYGDSNFKSPESHLKRPCHASTYDQSSNKRLRTGELPPPRLKTGELPPPPLKTGELPPPHLKTGELATPPGRSGSMGRCRKVVAPLDDCDKNHSFLVNSQGRNQAETQHTLSGNSALASIQRSGNAEGVNHTEIEAIQDFSKKSDNVELDHPQYNGQEVRKSIQNMGASGANLMEILDRNPMKNHRKQIISVRAPESPRNVQKDAPLNNPDFFSDLNKRKLMVNSNTDLQSLLDYEELLDKEIDEAQEHRRKCEVEEKNALMAYRKAQRVLIDAHARCSQIYSKRELYSAQLRSYMMENPNLFSSQREAGLNSSNNASDVDLQRMPSSCNQVLGGSNVVDHGVHAADIPSANNEYQNISNLHVSETNLEPDGSPSKDSKQSFSSDACSSSGGLSQSSYEDIEELNHKSAQKNIVYEGMSEVDEGREKDIYEESERQGPAGSSQDCLLLEASLRAQLFEKMKGKGLLRRSKSADDLVEKGTNNDNDIKMMDTDVEDTVLLEARNGRHLEIVGTSQVLALESFDRQLEIEDGNQEGRSPALPTQINCQSAIPNPEHESPTKLSMDCCVSLDFEQPTVSGAILFPSLKNTFINPKVMKLIGVLESKSTSPGVPFPLSEENEDGDSFNKSKLCIQSLGTTGSAAMDLYNGSAMDLYNGSSSSGVTIDPVRPLCMYELRGKCNSDECSWQHARDYSSANSGKEHFSRLNKLDNFFLAPPTYVVGKHILRADACLHTAASPQCYGQCWRKCFSSFLVLSYLCPTALPSNEPFLHGTEVRIEDDSSWNRHLYGTLSQLDQCTSGVEQSVETALLKLSEDVNKRITRLEAARVLARAIEKNASSAVLWIVYLLIFYSNQSPTAKNDFFKPAVKYNKESYDLWLLCISSRDQLEDQLAAYDAALSDICCHASKSDVDTLHVSQCILDIFLQMINRLCMSGNVGRAIERICGLHSSSEKSGDQPQLSMNNIVACLTISDKVIFWICCIYLFVYKKLPDLVVQRLECRKEPSAIEWPSAYLKPDEKQQAGTLMEIAVNSLESYLNHESLENEKNLRAAHLFALNQVRCVLVLEGLECSRKLLEKYIKLYPSCPELVLMSARTEYELGGSSFYGFEEALRTRPSEVGFQFIWNQYARLALRSGKVDFVKELMQRWLHSVLEAQDSDRSLESASVTDLHDRFFKCGQNDQVFGMLNLSLYKLLQNDQAEARRASELALKAATVDTFHLCLKELVPFWLTDCVRQHEGDFIKGIVNIVNVYAAETRSLLVTEPLSRVFVKEIKKPRVQQLLGKLLSPVSADFFLMHVVCEVWHALSVLPDVFAKPTVLVDLVEAMMEILPSNYLFAILVCKELCKSSHTTLPSSLSFWAGSVLVTALYQAVPIAPEYVWVEAAEVLGKLTDIRAIKESFLKKALAVYPFSLKLWTSRLHLSDAELHVELVKEAAKKIGIELD